MAGLIIVAVSAGGEEPAVVVNPMASDELLANPGIGWETFNRTRDEDQNLPAWIPSTIAYTRWSWRQLEPVPGTIDTSLIDETLSRAKASGQQVAMRIMCCNTVDSRPYHPDWIKEVGGIELLVDYAGTTVPLPIPDLDDPVVLDRHIDFIQRFGARYDGHPDILRMEIGTVGWWGEWHMSRSTQARLPTLANRMKVIDAYAAAFQKTPLMIVIGAGDGLERAIRHGAGWRADSLGDLGSFSPTWNHMRDAYPAMFNRHQLHDAWKAAPIAFEPPRNVSEFVDKKWPIRGIFNYALALHGSSFNGKSAKLPDDGHFRDELRRFLRRLGYRFVAKACSHPGRVAPGMPFAITTRWQNVGSAPCYKPCRVAYRLNGPDGRGRVFVARASVERWLPGAVPLFDEAFLKSPPDLPPGKVHTVVENVSIPKDFPEGEYTLAVAVVGETSDEPAIRLAIEGRTADGWYPLSAVRVAR